MTTGHEVVETYEFGVTPATLGCASRRNPARKYKLRPMLEDLGRQ